MREEDPTLNSPPFSRKESPGRSCLSSTLAPHTPCFLPPAAAPLRPDLLLRIVTLITPSPCVSTQGPFASVTVIVMVAVAYCPWPWWRPSSYQLPACLVLPWQPWQCSFSLRPHLQQRCLQQLQQQQYQVEYRVIEPTNPNANEATTVAQRYAQRPQTISSPS
jgi:hypothetical protein